MSQTHLFDGLSQIGATRQQLLAKLGINCRRDFLQHPPRKYEDWTSLLLIRDLQPDTESTVLALCIEAPSLQWSRGGGFRVAGKKKGSHSNYLRARFADATGQIQVIWFQQNYLKHHVQEGHLYLLHGKTSKSDKPTFINPAFEEWELEELKGKFPYLQLALSQQLQLEGQQNFLPIRPDLLEGRYLRPIYATTQGLSQRQLRIWVREALRLEEKFLLEELFPEDLRQRQGLISRKRAYEQLHFPSSNQELKEARQYFAFEEIFLFQLRLARLRLERGRQTAYPMKWEEGMAKDYQKVLDALPFELTKAQKQAMRLLQQKLFSKHSMDVLLQGDVGSGKTVVAALCMAFCLQQGYQVALMAPTSILARQHFKSLSQFLAPLGKKVVLLLGKGKKREKKAIYEGIAKGDIQVVVGTQALLQEGVKFRQLALVVTDEQHRFGVSQRLQLLQQEQSEQAQETQAQTQTEEGRAEAGKRYAPHVLVMSATPIPRSLALVLYGDVSLVVMNELPKGRQEVKTYSLRGEQFQSALELVQHFVRQGEQVYVVCPRKEEGEELGTGHLYSVEEMVPLIQSALPSCRVAGLRGDMKEETKQEVMEAFLDRQVDILVSTTVVEVGVDNPNANLLLVMNAERFGLAQLHQLRGRVGRGNRPALCLLHTEKRSGSVPERLALLCESRDGFYLAERDLEMRGPGELFGLRQHGVPEFQFVEEGQLAFWLERVQPEVERILAEDPQLCEERHQSLKKRLEADGQEGKLGI